MQKNGKILFVTIFSLILGYFIIFSEKIGFHFISTSIFCFSFILLFVFLNLYFMVGGINHKILNYFYFSG